MLLQSNHDGTKKKETPAMGAAERNGSEGGADPVAPGLHFTLANTKYSISLCSSSVPATVSHPRVPPGTGRRQLHHEHPAPPTHGAPLKHYLNLFWL